MEDNQTYINISDFQHNGTNCNQNVSCSVSDGMYQLWGLFCIQLVLYWVVFFIAFPGICFALYKLRSQVRPDQLAHVYVTNLLISDLIQTCVNPIQMTAEYQRRFTSFGDLYSFYTDMYGGRIYYFGVMVNIVFMMCVSAERYMMVAHPIWFRHIQNRNVPVIVSVTIWILSAFWIISLFWVNPYLLYILSAVLLLPYPLVTFFFVATWRALSRSSVPRNDQIRIRSILGLILCIYTILFIPFIIMALDLVFLNFYALHIYHGIAHILIALNPLFDLLLYVLIRKDVTHMCKALLFCCNKRQGADITHG